jgi:hypothetical protein
MVKLLFVAVAAFAATAAAAQGDSSTEPAAAAETENQTQVICRTVADLGTRLGRSRVCRTRAEWAASRRDSRSQIDRAQGGGRTTSNGN